MKTPITQLSWQGRLSIEEVHPLRIALLSALNQDAEVFVDLAGVTAIDLACVQLLCAACGSAAMRGKQLSLRNAGNPALGQTLRENGLNYRENCLRSRNTSCLWPQEKGGTDDDGPL